MNRPLDEVEALLRRELVPARYPATVEAEATLAEVARRVDRARRLRQTATATAAAALVAAVVTAVALLTGTPADQAGPATSAAGPASSPLVIAGVPEGLVATADVPGAARRPPSLGVIPEGGRQAAYLSTATGTVWRLVVAADPVDEPGLLGTPVEIPPWWSLGGQLLMTDHDGTLYLKAWQPDGHRWFVALTGGDLAQRLTAANRVATSNFTM
ncbi:hypothetical protein KZZ52_51105 [Dactylosporangium sp. AC04546]|uniref:hypothetical protein n=1 Tax=Dactylosporangium sp. AC04546 TaxID=2862460 RepID=UPI001EDF2708|nr:hypothetical protein [Dactylosporangium sp. AC04546]WVK82216.1 hypothetical protein KZZ52_51105 [Dactylosporangium sp. AC04546]